MSERRPRSPLLRLLALAVLAACSISFAADVERSVLLDDEVEAEIGTDEVHAYRLAVVAATALDVRLEAESEGGGKSASGPAPVLALLGPGGAELALDASSRPRIRFTTTTGGTHRIEVRSGSFSGEYELHVEGEIPDGESSTVTVDGAAQSVMVDAPVGAAVRLDVRRLSGATPEIVRVLDGAGRDIGFDVKSQRRNRVKTHAIPVTAPGGLRVEVAAAGGGAGSYSVKARFDDDRDDLPEGDDDHESRRIVLTLAPGADAAAIADQLGYELLSEHEGYAVFETPEGREGFEEDDARDADDRLDDVLGAELEARLQTPEGTQSNKVVLGSALGRIDFDTQAALERLRATAAQRRATGRGVVVAVLDTGIDRSHPLFDPTRILAGRDFVDGDGDPSEEQNGLDDDLDGEIDEGYGHGTFVAGLILATAPDATILPVRVLDTDATGAVSRIGAGIRYAVDQGADVLNLSFGARVRSEILRGEVRYALSRGVVVVAATGNRADTGRIDFPAGIAGVVAVSALSGNSGRAAFANAGKATTVAAPGADVIGPYPGGEWATWSGTSFAAALTAGALADLEQLRPALRPAAVVRRTRRAGASLPRRIPAAERRALGGGALNMQRLVR